MAQEPELRTDRRRVVGEVGPGRVHGPDGAMYFTWRLNTGAAQIVRLQVMPRPPPVPPTPLTPAVLPSPVVTRVVIAPSFTG